MALESVRFCCSGDKLMRADSDIGKPSRDVVNSVIRVFMDDT